MDPGRKMEILEFAPVRACAMVDERNPRRARDETIANHITPSAASSVSCRARTVPSRGCVQWLSERKILYHPTQLPSQIQLSYINRQRRLRLALISRQNRSVSVKAERWGLVEKVAQLTSKRRSYSLYHRDGLIAHYKSTFAASLKFPEFSCPVVLHYTFGQTRVRRLNPKYRATATISLMSADH